jgi:putative endonuclease
MYYCYIIYSAAKNKFYVGSTSNLDDRVKKHNSNHKGFTGSHLDWEIKWAQAFDQKTNAMAREKQIKAWKSRKMIERLIHKD